METKKIISEMNSTYLSNSPAKTKRVISLNQIIKPIMFIIFALLFEIINFNVMGLTFLPTFILFDLGIMFLFAGIIFASNYNWLSNLLFFIFLLPQLVLNIINGTILNVSNDSFYFQLLESHQRECQPLIGLL